MNSISPLNLDTSSKPKSLDEYAKNEKYQSAGNIASTEAGSLPRSGAAQPISDAVNNSVPAEQLDGVMRSLNENIQNLQSYLRFEKDENTEKMVFFIKNSETDEVLRQVPSQELLTISKNISDYLEMVNQSSRDSLPPVGLITDQVV